MYESATISAGAMTIESIEDASVAMLARLMQRLWISTIGYMMFQPPRLKYVVCDDVSSFVISVRGGSRGPKPTGGIR